MFTLQFAVLSSLIKVQIKDKIMLTSYVLVDASGGVHCRARRISALLDIIAPLRFKSKQQFTKIRKKRRFIPRQTILKHHLPKVSPLPNNLAYITRPDILFDAEHGSCHSSHLPPFQPFYTHPNT